MTDQQPAANPWLTPAQPRREDVPLVLGAHTFTSRLFVGTGKYADLATMRDALDASGTECVTVAVRRLSLGVPQGKTLLDYLDTRRYRLLPNTAGCFDADSAIRTARLGREAGMSELVKLEVLGDPDTLLPDPVGTLEAAKVLVKEGFTVLCYTSDDPVLAKRLEDLGCAAVMPAGAPIGSGLGILNRNNLSIILERARVPVLVDAGVGTASDVSIAMELGADGVLLNTGIALAKDPVCMARAMRLACEAGRLAWLAGRMGSRRYASASSPMQGRIGIAGD
ncbi:MAG: thiazole synthase [Planctomycetes bacterium]|nr:thiazole synthase [Planctomycetota bacterium]